MPDKRKHRGKHPEDDRLFAPAQHDALRTRRRRSRMAAFSGLRPRRLPQARRRSIRTHRPPTTRRHAIHLLRPRTQGTASGAGPHLTRKHLRHWPSTDTTCSSRLEAALSRGLILVGRDGCCRDLAGLHGTYHRVAETETALQLIVAHLRHACGSRAGEGLLRVDWYLDQPVSNSGRLKAFMADTLEQLGCVLIPDANAPNARPTWNIELVDDPGRQAAALRPPPFGSEVAGRWCVRDVPCAYTRLVRRASCATHSPIHATTKRGSHWWQPPTRASSIDAGCG